MVRYLSQFLRILWRVWFYALTAILVTVLFPVLFLLTLSEKVYPVFFWVARNLWAIPILYGVGFIPKIEREMPLKKNKSYMFVANHTSMIDIMLMMKCSKNPFVFIGKEELTKIPLFGFLYKRICITVDRKSTKSKVGVYLKAEQVLKSRCSICIFPEGGVPNDESIVLAPFKGGAFKMAIAHQIPIIPFVLLDCKKKFPYNFFKGIPGKLRSYQCKTIETHNLAKNNYNALMHQVRNIILNKLQENIKIRANYKDNS